MTAKEERKQMERQLQRTSDLLSVEQDKYRKLLEKVKVPESF